MAPLDPERRDQLRRRRAELLDERGRLQARLAERVAAFERRDRWIERTSLGLGLGGLILAPITGGWSAAASLASFAAGVWGTRQDDWDVNRIRWIEDRIDEIADELADIALEALTGER